MRLQNYNFLRVYFNVFRARRKFFPLREDWLFHSVKFHLSQKLWSLLKLIFQLSHHKFYSQPCWPFSLLWNYETAPAHDTARVLQFSSSCRLLGRNWTPILLFANPTSRIRISHFVVLALVAVPPIAKIKSSRVLLKFRFRRLGRLHRCAAYECTRGSLVFSIFYYFRTRKPIMNVLT